MIKEFIQEYSRWMKVKEVPDPLLQIVADLNDGKISWDDLSEELLDQHVSICRKLLNLDITWFSRLRPCDQNETDVIKHAIYLDKTFYSRLSPEQRANETFFLFAWSYHPELFSELPVAFKENKEEVVKYIRNSSKPDTYFNALSKDIEDLKEWSLRFVDMLQDGDQEFRRFYVPDMFFNDMLWCIEAVGRNNLVLNLLPRELAGDPFFVYKVLKLPSCDAAKTLAMMNWMNYDLKFLLSGKNLWEGLRELAATELLKEKHGALFQNAVMSDSLSAL